MEEYNYCEELREKYNIVELDSKTLDYHINGFINACNMDLSNSPCTKEIGGMFLPYINKQYDFDEVKYNNMIVPVFLYYDGSVLATASELEEYLKYYTDKNNYNTDSEYFDVRIELKKQLDSLFADAKEDYLKFIESRDYSEHYKIEKVKEKYRQFF